MRFLRLHFPFYFRRLRWEIAGWWLLSGSLSVLFHQGRGVETLVGLSQAEFIVALWVVLRLALIDDVFGTLSGRQFRPVRWWEILAARLLLILVAFLPPLLLRLFAWQRWAMPEPGMWVEYLLETVAPELGFLFLAGLGIQLAATLNRWAFKRGRKTGAVIMAVLAGWGLLHFANRYSWRSLHHMDHFGVHPHEDVLDPDDALLGVKALLPSDAVLLGSWRSYYPSSYPVMRELIRLPLREGRIPVEPGVEALISKPELSGWNLSFEMRLRCRDQQTARKFTRNMIQVVRFRDGYYSEVSNGGGGWPGSPLRLLPMCDVVLKLDAIAPVVMPWRDADKGTGIENAELIFYTWDQQAASVPIPPDPCIRFVRQPEPERPPSPHNIWRKKPKPEDLPPATELAHLPPISKKYGSWSSGKKGSYEIYSVIPDEAGTPAEDKIRGSFMMISAYGEKDPRILETVMGMGRDAIPPILAWPAWTDAAWEQIVRPVLLAQVTLEDRPALLERLKTETRLAEIFTAKGWAAEALPVLRARATEGLPLDLEALKILASGKDLSLAADLKRVALTSSAGSEELDALLKEYPGFDWQGYALESWHMRRNRWQPFDPNPWPAIRAARAGDASAFRHVAEQAVQEQQGFENALRKLVQGEPQDVIAQVKEKHAAMRFDPASGNWAVQR